MAEKWNIFYRQFITYRGYEAVLDGLKITVEIAVLGLILGILIGTLIAAVKVMPKYRLLPRILEKICDIYVGFFRGTPIMVQLLLGYFVLKLPFSAFWVATMVYGMNSGAYVSEIMRSGIQSVDIGQLEAARALGLGFPVSMLKVVIPQAIKNILPTIGNEFIALIKETSVVSFIAIVDVTKAFKQLGDASYEYVIPYLMLALVYLILVYFISLLIKLLERRLKKNERAKH